MSVAPSPEPEPHPLLQGASPRTVREWLSPELAARFDDAYRAAIDTARSTFELEPVYTVVEDFRRIAILETDPAAFRRTMRAAAELATGEPSPEDEPWQTTLTKAGL
ncbi:DUF6247 family protein [Actinomycetospora sp. NBRC 106378]|uniref:DUF6247 family protein n=1 Tax=Actinomycetospora sp. NBRC 106378 TaxID=3032208 RepID=UPI002555F24E|nr:DUF6247 family protein [Actinomycetospora sp. NBRC 106378]